MIVADFLLLSCKCLPESYLNPSYLYMLSSASIIIQKGPTEEDSSVILRQHKHSELVNFKSFTKSKFRRTAETEKANYEIPKAGREGKISYLPLFTVLSK